MFKLDNLGLGYYRDTVAGTGNADGSLAEGDAFEEEFLDLETNFEAYRASFDPGRGWVGMEATQTLEGSFLAVSKTIFAINYLVFNYSNCYICFKINKICTLIGILWYPEKLYPFSASRNF